MSGRFASVGPRRFASVGPRRFASMASVALWSLIAIVITGVSVRLTGSGLGCSDWPNCEPGELVPAVGFHAWVEFGNRIVTGLVTLTVIMAVSGALVRAPRRRDLVWWSAGLVAGVLAQVVLGGITVLSHLSPPIVMAHFLLSSVLVMAATVLASRARLADNGTADDTGACDTDDTGACDTDDTGACAAARPLTLSQHERIRQNEVVARTAARARTLCWGVAVLTAVALFTGTAVTAAGPHGGDEQVERLSFALGDVARIHGITVVATVALTLGLLLWLTRAHLPAVMRRVEILIVVLAIQGTIGYVQYFNRLPVILVGIHVTGATLAVVAVTRLVLTARLTATTTP